MVETTPGDEMPSRDMNEEPSPGGMTSMEAEEPALEAVTAETAAAVPAEAQELPPRMEPELIAYLEGQEEEEQSGAQP